MNDKALRTLEYSKIIEKLRGFAVSKMGKETAETLKPMKDINEIINSQKETSEAVSMILKKGSLSLGGLKDIRSYIKRVAVGGMLSAAELIDTSDFIRTCKIAKKYSAAESKNDIFEILMPKFDLIEISSELEREINRCIISENEISDDATSELRNIRQSISSSNNKIKEQLNSIIHSQSYKNMLQEPVITMRSGRYCVPVKQEYRNSFNGMVHDQSATGATFFIEPIGVVQLNNKIKELQIKEKNEIEKILIYLSEKVNENADLLLSNTEILTEIDFIFAKGELSISMNATEPIFNNKGYINLKKARHPLIDKNSVVPTNIYLGKEFTTLLITGPNTGGKTVSLKTIGLFTLMGQAGLHIPAFDNSELSVFDEVFADIGDEQSIEQSLSTFSSHMKNIVKIIDEVTDKSLVLLDELGAGTDPTEGAALAVSVIEYLHKRKIRTAVTTHYSELKIYAISKDGVENAACEFDVNSLKPTYNLLIGVPGKSNAFAISKRLGLPEFIINDAKQYLSHDDRRLEDVICDLEISRKTLSIEQERAKQYRLESENLKKELEEQKIKTKTQKDKIILSAHEQARKMLSDAKDEADKIVKQMQKMIKMNVSYKELEEQRQKLKSKLSDVDNKISNSAKKNIKHKKINKKLVKGDGVFINSLNQTGIVINPPDSKGDLMVRAGIMNIKVNISDLSMDDSVKKEKNIMKQYSSSTVSKKSQYISPEVDLRGLMVEEAIEKTDKYLDDACLAGVSPVTIIHGKGTGVLRNAIHDYLKNQTYVKSYRLGVYGEGETGVTIVELK